MAKLLLTNKESMDLRRLCAWEGDDQRAIAKAQLQKVVEWLQHRTYGFDNGSGQMVFKTVYEAMEWEDLKKEVGL